MDSRTAPRAAEKAARDLMNSRAAVVGELAVASAERAQLETQVTVASERGRQLVAKAEAEAARLLNAAQVCVQDAEQHYADVYSATTAAGWAPADLTALGFHPVPTSTRRRRSTPDPPAGNNAFPPPDPSRGRHSPTRDG